MRRIPHDAVRRHRRAIVLIAVALTACHHEPTGLEVPDDDAVGAMARFAEIADAATVAGADRRVGDGYRGIALLLARHARTTTVRLTVDGVEEDWIAFAREVAFPAPEPCPRGVICDNFFPDPHVASVIAWNRADARRVVQFTTPGGLAPLGGAADVFVFPGAFMGGPSLTYLDGRGGLFTAASGTQSLDVTHTDWRCAEVASAVIAVIYVIPATCTVAGMRAAFSATVQPPVLFWPLGNTGAGTHAISMRAQDVAGARTEVPGCGSCYPASLPVALLPPVRMRGSEPLPSFLRVTRDSVVTFTLDVWNNGTAPAVVRFADARQYEIVVTRFSAGPDVWRWGAERAFAQGETSRTLAPNEHWIITEKWRPPASGAYLARAFLTSTTHFVEAAGFVDVR